jgi:hypothetical protein
LGYLETDRDAAARQRQDYWLRAFEMSQLGG